VNPVVARTRGELGQSIAARPAGRVGLVPTMGALHQGHAKLIDVARARSETVVTSIFVNPMQFGPTEDLARYPRTFDADLALCSEHGVDIVFAPEVETVYPGGEPEVTVDPGPRAAELEGAARPGHFRGVLTVVAKIFGLVAPDLALFGEKDYQQLVLIRRMASDLCMPVDIVGVATVREDDGLALSSRNSYLSAAERARALALSRALYAGQAAAAEGPDAVLKAADAVLAEADGIAVDYLELRSTDLAEAPADGAARLLVAARVGGTRLIDNVAVDLSKQGENR
jgi:pantoate--beta-alanine ligase